MNTPRYEYSRSVITDRINLLNNLDAPFGLKIRYAIKANPHPEIISMMNNNEIYFDASSSYEAVELLDQGIDGSRISLSSQQSPHVLESLLEQGVTFVATSLQQLRIFLDTPNRPDTVSVRINPDVGYGHNNRTSTGGLSAGFGIWHEYIPQILEMTQQSGVTVDRVHTHIGSGADPDVWAEVMDNVLDVVAQFPDATCLDIGGGYKVRRYGTEKETDMAAVVNVFTDKLLQFKESTGRQIELEIEPGSYFVAHAGTLVASVDDIVDTGADGYTFLRLNTGMNDFLRTTMYGAQHKIQVMNDNTEQMEYVVIGHNCESGDILTCASGDAETIETRLLNQAQIGDEVRILDAGAYCQSMSAKGYNSFPDASTVFVD